MTKEESEYIEKEVQEIAFTLTSEDGEEAVVSLKDLMCILEKVRMV